MFDNLKQPEDIFAQTDKEAPQVKPPTAPPSGVPVQTAVPPEQTPRDPALTPETIQQRVAQMGAEHPSGGGGGLKVVLIVLTIIVIIGAAFYLSWRILTSKTPVTPAVPEEISQPTPQPEPLETVPEEITPESEPEPVADLDSDQDGLTDAREQELGTDLNVSDTDQDGLFDREEVEVYFTDPLNPDTDGDTYTDGGEVESGYNPNGPGKLLEVPSAS